MSKRRVLASVAAAGVMATAVIRGMTRRFEIKESSMYPALDAGDWVIAKRRGREPERGDIVVFTDPTGSGMNLVKRVIGLEGEHISIDKGRVGVDGAVLADRWANGITLPDGEWDVPDGHVWVLGDNRGMSRSDSRLLGSVATDEIGWRVIAVYWPRTRIKSLG